MRRNKTLQFAVDFAHKCDALKLTPFELAELITLRDRVGGLTLSNSTNKATETRLKNARADFIEFARTLNFTVCFSNPYPGLTRDGFEEYLPSF